ncbi:nucleotide exchange factor GrpE [Halonotius aquaticus]|uniref:Protein GrpE n=1 Tax=Halonotius aquaticus TaxID=2216978 RepID=A0A3A6PX82_9EURY|nr:nucleotide exchange factor GrpE [Halonotius aquaticus]RJX45177.1 nucleotide exchange factor GrpE [Halonotius aquaticus]
MSEDAAAVEESDPETDAAADEPTDDDSEAIEALPADELVDRIIDSDETLTEPATELRSRIEALENEVAEKNNEIDELTEKLSRARADFKNYKKRTKQQQEEMKARATEELVERLTDVRDNLVRALDQDDDADIRPGVESTLESFDRALEDENVAFISPAAGDEVDPERHEVMQRVDSDQPAGTIVDIYQEGYEMADKVLQPARVTVSTDE